MRGANRLASLLEDRMERRVREVRPADLATVLEDGSLALDGFSVPIPETDYDVCEHVGMTVGGDRVVVQMIGETDAPVVVVTGRLRG